ncbi:MAG TPA: 4Fe-4S dicluster domain-containing protein [Bacillota bacterium]|nr:4Fe-4S dicluster domain-containing protein [Bacillota bacterium]
MNFTRRQFIESLAMLGLLYLVTPGNLLQAGTIPLRPPGALPERDFNLKCIRCFKCGQACRAQAIRFGGWTEGQLADTPVLSALRTNPCTLCMECNKVCSSGALRSVPASLPVISKKVKIGVATIDKSRCVLWSEKRPKCLMCKRSCPYEGEAITADEKGRPVIHPDKCVGCGRCEQLCPVEPAAIVVKGVSS